MPLTPIWGIYYADGSTPLSVEDITSTMASSIEDALGDVANYRFVQTIYYTSNGTFTKATYPWLRAIRVKVVGGGGGGGGAATTGASQVAVGGAGGGGAYSEAFITNITGLASSVTVTVGAGGTAATAGNNNGGAGGTGSFGAAVVANGGAGGVGQSTAGVPRYVVDTAGGLTTGGSGDLLLPGGAAPAFSVPASNVVLQGASGATALSPSGRGGGVTGSGSAGSAGIGYGTGGTGGVNAASQATARAGGPGAAGIVIVELYA